MNTKNITPVQYSGKICFKCLKEFDRSNIITIHFCDQGYGSLFDGFNSKMQLCTECYNKTNKDIWNMNIIPDENDNRLKHYEHETEIIEFINELPIEGKELFLNRIAWGSTVFSMNSQDWIDYNLKELSHEKCKEYKLMSQEEISAYQERFPKCKYPVNMIESDGNKVSYCPCGSYGKYGQEIDNTLYMNCYNCPLYKERTEKDELLDLNFDEGELYKIYVLYEKNKKEIKKILKGK